MSSDADNERVTLDDVVSDAPLLIEILGFKGGLVSLTINVIESEELEETLPAASLNHKYTVLEYDPAALGVETVKLFELERFLVDVVATHPESVELGVEEDSEAK